MVQLDARDIQAVYGKQSEQYPTEKIWLYTEMENFMTSSPVILIKLRGKGAIKKTKKELVGKYCSRVGLRWLYSETIIKNVAHAPDNPKEAMEHLQYFESHFQKERTMNRERFKDIKVFALTGMSECGKSTVGRYFESKGIPRLKIVKIFEQIKDKQDPKEKDAKTFVSKRKQADPLALWDSFIDELLLEMNSRSVNSASIESLYGGGMGPHLKQKLGDSFCLLYIDASAEVRLQRQIKRRSLANIEEAKQIMLPRDKFKAQTGVPALKKQADEIVDNSGSLEELHAQVERIITKHKK